MARTPRAHPPGEHGGATHARSFYEEVLATPFWIRAPTIPPGPKLSCPVGCPDVVRMVRRAAADLAAPPCRPSHRFAVIDFPGRAARGPQSTHLRSLHLPDGWKVIYNAGLDLWKLYDLQRDPAEQHSLAASEPANLRRASKELETVLLRCRGADTARRGMACNRRR